MTVDLEANKRVVTEFYQTAFDGNPRKAVADHIGDRYVQHHPSVPDGPESFISFVEASLAEHPEFKLEIRRVIAEGDLVVCHCYQTVGPGLPDQALVDIYRVEDGKIVEHWDVIQDVPETSANGNGMV